jgi:hypothetical protein
MKEKVRRITGPKINTNGRVVKTEKENNKR